MTIITYIYPYHATDILDIVSLRKHAIVIDWLMRLLFVINYNELYTEWKHNA